MENKRLIIYPIYDLGELDLDKSESFLRIPSIQRGLVWKPVQTELLWDSILRGFPIGTFTVLVKPGAPSDLIDGQQRLNAIISGFKEPSRGGDSAVWIDLKFNPSDKKTREFGIRVTTRAHPWGYHLDGTVLNTSERRNALEAAKQKEGTLKKDWNLLDFSPADCTLPVPLSIVLNAGKVDPQERLGFIKDGCRCFANKEGATGWALKYLTGVDQLHPEDITTLLEALSNLQDYSVIATAIDSRPELDLEVLFERIGTGGTPITQKELAYAAIKQHIDVDGSIKKVNGSIPNRPVDEADFAMLIFRLFLSGEDNIVENVSVDDVRRIDKSTKEILLKAYADDGKLIRCLVDKVDGWLLNGDIPPVIRSEIAWSYSKLYVFLLWLARIDEEKELKLEAEYVQALAFYLYVMVKPYYGRNKELYRPWVIQYLYSNLNRWTKDVQGQMLGKQFSAKVTALLDEMLNLDWCISPTDNLDTFLALEESEWSPSWNPFNYARERNNDLFVKLFPYWGNRYSQFILKLFQKDYYNRYFSDYDPSRADLWIESNRPWDHDHIIPRQWGEAEGEWKEACGYLINSIGNIADIPYELNRSKGNRCDWEHYREKDNQEKLGVDLNSLSVFGDGKTTPMLTGEKELAKVFFGFVADRFKRMSSHFLAMVNKLGVGKNLTAVASCRKEFLIGLQREHFTGYSFYYVVDGVERVFQEDDVYAWNQQWISLAEFKSGEKYMNAITIGIENDGQECTPKLVIQYGLRKAANVNFSEIKAWWAPGGYNHIKKFAVKESGQLDEAKQTLLDFFHNEINKKESNA